MRLALLVISIILFIGCVSTSGYIKPDDLLEKANAEYLRGNFVSAIDCYKRCLGQNLSQDEIVEANYRIGLCYLKLNDPENAIENLNKALKDTTSNILKLRIYKDLAFAYGMKQDVAKALESLKIINSAPRSIVEQAVKRDELLYNLGIWHIRNLEWQEGRLYLRKLLAEYPQSEKVQNSNIILSIREDKFYVQLGYFNERKNAEDKLSELKAQGIHTFIKEADSSHQTAYLILYSGFSKWSDAKQEVERLKKSGIEAVTIP